MAPRERALRDSSTDLQANPRARGDGRRDQEGRASPEHLQVRLAAFGEAALTGTDEVISIRTRFPHVEERQGRVDVTRREPRLFLPVREVERLKRVLAESARLTNLDWTRIETFRAPVEPSYTGLRSGTPVGKNCCRTLGI